MLGPRGNIILFHSPLSTITNSRWYRPGAVRVGRLAWHTSCAWSTWLEMWGLQSAGVTGTSVEAVLLGTSLPCEVLLAPSPLTQSRHILETVRNKKEQNTWSRYQFLSGIKILALSPRMKGNETSGYQWWFFVVVIVKKPHNAAHRDTHWQYVGVFICILKNINPGSVKMWVSLEFDVSSFQWMKWFLVAFSSP